MGNWYNEAYSFSIFEANIGVASTDNRKHSSWDPRLLSSIAGTQWGNKKYMNMKHLEAMDTASLAG